MCFALLFLPSLFPVPTEESADPVDYDGTGTGSNQPTGKMLYCEPRTSRGLHWNWTRAGNVHVQKCPGGATGKCLTFMIPYDTSLLK